MTEENLAKEKIIKVSKGEIIIRKPKAGMRNAAALKSYVVNDKGVGSINEVQFLTEILPACIVKHPFGTTPLKKALEDLEIEEYDELMFAVRGFLGIIPTGDAAKKSD